MIILLARKVAIQNQLQQQESSSSAQFPPPRKILANVGVCHLLEPATNGRPYAARGGGVSMRCRSVVSAAPPTRDTASVVGAASGVGQPSEGKRAGGRETGDTPTRAGVGRDSETPDSRRDDGDFSIFFFFFFFSVSCLQEQVSCRLH